MAEKKDCTQVCDQLRMGNGYSIYLNQVLQGKSIHFLSQLQSQSGRNREMALDLQRKRRPRKSRRDRRWRDSLEASQTPLDLLQEWQELKGRKSSEITTTMLRDKGTDGRTDALRIKPH